MPKLPMQSMPGFNSGKNHSVRLMRLSNAKTDPEFSGLFKRDEKVINAIAESIKERGFDPEQPITLWKSFNIVVDGYTRFEAATKIGLEEVWVSDREFESREDAILYALERQAIRRNLSGNEILIAAQLIPDIRGENGKGRQAKITADRLGVSIDMIYKARRVSKEAPEEDLQAIQNGEKTITEVAKKLPKTNKPEKTTLDFIMDNLAAAYSKIQGVVDQNYITDPECSDLLKNALDYIERARNKLAILE